MIRLDFLKLLLLSAIWGGSFLFMRVASPEFGPIFLIWTRVALATAFLSPVLLRPEVRRDLKENPGRMLRLGVFNAAIPWCLLAYAVLSLEAGFTSLLNAATPIFAAIIGFLWLRLPLTKLQQLGLLIGIIGVAILAWDQILPGENNRALAIAATLLATICYGYASPVSYTHLRAHETDSYLVCRLLLEKKKK